MDADAAARRRQWSGTPGEVEHYDVIVAGAGLSGLAMGAELSEHFKVLVVDPKAEYRKLPGSELDSADPGPGTGRCHQSWFVPGFVWRHVGPQEKPFLYDGVKHFLVDFAGGPTTAWHRHTTLPYFYVREHELLDHLGRRIVRNGQRNGSTVRLGSAYLDHAAQDGQVTVLTRERLAGRPPAPSAEDASADGRTRRYTARLLVDATGHTSPIRARQGVPDKEYWWSVYGAIVEHPPGTILPSEDRLRHRYDQSRLYEGDYLLWATFDDLAVDADASLARGMPVMEYEVLTDTRSFPMVLYLRPEKVPYDTMRAVFGHMLREERRVRDRFATGKRIEEKWGWYRSGGVSQKLADERVAFVGDAGCWSAPCGWGAGFILANYVDFAKELAAALDEDKLDRESLLARIHVDLHTRHKLLLNRIMARFLSHATADQLRTFASMFKALDQEEEGKGWSLCERVFTLNPDLKDVGVLVTALLRHVGPGPLLSVFPRAEIPTALAEAVTLGLEIASVAGEQLWDFGRDVLHLPLPERDRHEECADEPLTPDEPLAADSA